MRLGILLRVSLLAAYVALAIVIGVAYGTRGLAILLFFYFLPLAWLAFLSGLGLGRSPLRPLELPPSRRPPLTPSAP
jgi:hypothetical protein